jgi:hypothetical protein
LRESVHAESIKALIFGSVAMYKLVTAVDDFGAVGKYGEEFLSGVDGATEISKTGAIACPLLRLDVRPRAFMFGA